MKTRGGAKPKSVEETSLGLLQSQDQLTSISPEALRAVEFEIS
jgi:hypothetical protein